MWFLHNPKEAEEMSKHAVAKAKHYTWTAYEDGIRKCITDILHKD